MWRHYVYIHRRASNGAPFYIGKGTVKRRYKTAVFDRAHARAARNPWWRRIAAKYGFTVEIIAMFLDDETAQSFETELIAEFGRADLGLGPLVNVTDGGDGHAGIVVSKDIRLKRSANAAKPRSAAWVSSIRLARKNGGNGGVVKHGDTLPLHWRANIAAAKRGSLNPMCGRIGAAHPKSRRVIDSATGAIYESISAAANAAGLRMQSLHNMLTGHRPNTTSMRFP